MPEDRPVRIKRLRMRSWRRGTREMDLVLGPYADQALDGLNGIKLDAYEALLSENDIDLYLWYSGATPVPEKLAAALGDVQRFHLAPDA